MAIDYVIDYDCVPKQALGTKQILERIKGLERAQTIIDIYRQNQDYRPPDQMGFDFTRTRSDGTQETQLIVVQDLLNAAEPLKLLEGHCEGCPANRTGQRFGCMNFIQYPISSAAEAWLLNQLPGINESLVWLLLKRGVDHFAYDGQQIAALRQEGDTYFEDRRPAERRLGEFSLDANQVFDMIFNVGDIIPNHAAMLLLFFNAIERADLEADEIMQLAPATPEWIERLPFLHQVMPDDDQSTRELKGFLESLYIAWALNVKLLVDA